jgi:hypothetical protein
MRSRGRVGGKLRNRILRLMTILGISGAALSWAGVAFGASAAGVEHSGQAGAENTLGATAASGVLPFTGMSLVVIVLVALALVAMGFTVRRLSRARV